MDSEFSFVLVSSLQPSSSSKKLNNKAGKTTPKPTQPNRLKSNCRERSTKHIEKSLFKESNKENNCNEDNSEMTRKTRKSSLRSSGNNSSFEFPVLTDLNNICLRRPINTQNDGLGRLSKTTKIKSKCSPEIIIKDPYEFSFSDDSVNNSQHVNDKIISDSSKSNKSLLESSNSLKRRSYNNSSSSTINSVDSIPFLRPKRRANKPILETTESDSSPLNRIQTNITSSDISNDSTSNPEVIGVEHPRKKLRSSNSSCDVSLVEPSIVVKPTRKITTVLSEINGGEECNGKISSNEKSDEHDSLDNILSGKERKFFKRNKKNNREISVARFFNTRRSSINEIKDIRTLDTSVVEPSIVSPKNGGGEINGKTSVNESFGKHSIDSNLSAKEQKLFKGNKKSNIKISVGRNFNTRRSSIIENKDIQLSDVSVIEPSIVTPRTKKKNDKVNKLKKINPNNKTNVNLKIKKQQCSSQTNLISPPLSPDKLQNINEWLDETSKHTDLKMKIVESDSRENKEVIESNNKDEFDLSDASCCSESVGISEKLLNEMYGTFFHTNKKEVLPRSEPRKGLKKKKQRISIYEPFSSSSSEDRFEQFLENVNKAKIKPKSNVKLDTPEFINDSSSDNTSMTFYQSHLARDVKSDVGNLFEKKFNLTTLQLPKAKKNQRKLSFSSSSDSESNNTKKKLVRTKPRSKSNKNIENIDNCLIENNIAKSKEINYADIEDKKTNDIMKRKINDKILTPKNVNSPLEDIVDLVTPKKNKKPTTVLTTKDLVTPKSIKKPITGSTNKDKKITFNPTFVEANLTPFLARKKSKENNDENFKMPDTFNVINTPLPRPKNGSPGFTLSFLSSLSDDMGNLKCHPDALVYKKNFKKKKEELAKKLFNLYNKEVFENKLPSDMLIQWNARMRSTSGYCYNKRTNVAKGEIVRSSRLVLSTKILDRPGRLRDTLIHELCHAATWLINGLSNGHGPEWKAWADRATRRFPELPRIKRCHDYSIQTKYTYKCMGCGYCIGRHSKSLDVKLKRCGYCYGKFEVFLTSKVNTNNDAVPSESDSVKVQRTPSAFAMFVKENYGKVKQENKKLPHGDVMKLLGQKFAAIKLLKE